MYCNSDLPDHRISYADDNYHSYLFWHFSINTVCSFNSFIGDLKLFAAFPVSYILLSYSATYIMYIVSHLIVTSWNPRMV